MPKVITYGGDTKIGAYKFDDRKKVCLCIEIGVERQNYFFLEQLKVGIKSHAH